ncbi:MAG: hypothetical protein Q9172_000564 [Xanthocarpia lactea]
MDRLTDTEFNLALPHFVLKHLSILGKSTETLVNDLDNSNYILDTMSLSLGALSTGSELVNETLVERITAIKSLSNSLHDPLAATEGPSLTFASYVYRSALKTSLIIARLARLLLDVNRKRLELSEG